MKRVVVLLLSAAGAVAQGGRDEGRGPAPVLFVRWRASVESDAVHRTAWRALEPHDVTRRRLATFGGDPARARAYLRANRDARIVVAYNPEIARLARAELPGAALLEVHESEGAQVRAQTDRKRFIAAVGLLPEEFRFQGGRALTWVREGQAPPGKQVAVASTTAYLAEGRAVLTMRPDPRSLGQQVAAQVLRFLRTEKPFTRVTVRRMRLTVDLAAARRAGIRIPLRLLARADIVRRGP